jgi:DNA-binding transcriptional LysR family regulator
MDYDLNDLRYIAAVSATGSLSGAARKLAVNHATVFRRIAALERALGVRLFERGGGRYTPSAAGEELARTGAALEEQAGASLRRVAGRDMRPSGSVRLTTTDSIAFGLLMPMLKALRAHYPEIELQLIASNDVHDLSKRDADIAIRPSNAPPEHLVGRKIGKIAYAVYAHASLLRKRAAVQSWIAVDESLSQHRSLKWLQRSAAPETVQFRTNSFTGVLSATLAGLGHAVLPCFMGDTQRSLRRASAILSELNTDLWVLTHADLRETARIKATMGFVAHALQQHAALLEGKAYNSAALKRRARAVA